MKTIKPEAYLVITEEAFVAVVVGVFVVVLVHYRSANWTNQKSRRFLRKCDNSHGEGKREGQTGGHDKLNNTEREREGRKNTCQQNDSSQTMIILIEQQGRTSKQKFNKRKRIDKHGSVSTAWLENKWID